MMGRYRINNDNCDMNNHKSVFDDESATDNDKDAIDELRYYYGKSTR